MSIGWKRTLCACIAVFVACLIAELCLRFTGHLPSAAEPDDDLGWRWVPGARYLFREEGFSTGRFNSLGMRDVERAARKPDGVRRIALLGDSFVEGLHVPLEATFAAITERRMRDAGASVEVLNLARSGMGPTEELLVLKRVALALEPDAVCVVYLPGNDISDALPETTTDRTRPFARRQEDGITLDFGFRNSHGYLFRKIINPLKRHSALVSRGIALIRRLQQERLQENAHAGQADPLAPPRGVTSLFSSRPEPLYERAFDINLAVLEEIRRVCESRDRPLAVVVLPVFSYYPKQSLREAGVNPRAVAERIEGWAAARGVACLILQDEFDLRCAGGAILNYGGPEPWTYGHFNEEGHRATADILEPFLAELLRRPSRAQHTGERGHD